MTPQNIFVLLILSVFLIACSKTEVVKIDDSAPTEPTTPASGTTDTAETSEEPLAPSTGGAAIATDSGKTAKKCDDTDLNDPDIIGRVRVTYTDGSTKDYYDICTDIILTEFICEGTAVKSKNIICDNDCLNIPVKDESCPGCKVGSCFDLN